MPTRDFLNTARAGPSLVASSSASWDRSATSFAYLVYSSLFSGWGTRGKATTARGGGVSALHPQGRQPHNFEQDARVVQPYVEFRRVWVRTALLQYAEATCAGRQAFETHRVSRLGLQGDAVDKGELPPEVVVVQVRVTIVHGGHHHLLPSRGRGLLAPCLHMTMQEHNRHEREHAAHQHKDKQPLSDLNECQLLVVLQHGCCTLMGDASCAPLESCPCYVLGRCW